MSTACEDGACPDCRHVSIDQMCEERERLRGALQEIACGKVAADDEHPLGEWYSMAARFLTIAQGALRAPNESEEPK